MDSPTLYGIKNCDTMKKAFLWLENAGVAYGFHDYKKAGVEDDVLALAIQQCGWAEVINQRGTTWRKLPKNVQDTMNDVQAAQIARENPSIIKRPLLLYRGMAYLGFKDAQYHDIFIEK